MASRGDSAGLQRAAAEVGEGTSLTPTGVGWKLPLGISGLPCALVGWDSATKERLQKETQELAVGVGEGSTKGARLDGAPTAHAQQNSTPLIPRGRVSLPKYRMSTVFKGEVM